MALSVLYIHPCGIFGGASRSLLELIKAFPSQSIKPHLLTQDGSAVSYFEEHEIPVISVKGISQMDNTQYGYYRGTRWLIMLREFYFLPFTIWGMFKARKAWPDIDIVHINEMTMLAPILLAKFIFKKPLVLHVRSVQRDFSHSLRGRFILWALKRFPDSIIAIDQTVRNRIPPSLPVNIIHNGLSISGIPAEQLHKQVITAEAFKERPLRVAFVGNFLRLKGVVEFLHAAKICVDRGMQVEFLFVGNIPRKNSGFIRYVLKQFGLYEDLGEYLLQYVKQHELEQRIKFLGFIKDVSKIYSDTDILCFPSYLNAVGRPTIEAALFRVPSIVAIRNPESDTIIDGETGICIEEKSAMALADAIKQFYRQPHEITRMGEQAFQLAQRSFNIEHNAEKVLDIYRGCLEKQSD